VYISNSRIVSIVSAIITVSDDGGAEIDVSNCILEVGVSMLVFGCLSNSVVYIIEGAYVDHLVEELHGLSDGVINSESVRVRKASGVLDIAGLSNSLMAVEVFLGIE